MPPRADDARLDREDDAYEAARRAARPPATAATARAPRFVFGLHAIVLALPDSPYTAVVRQWGYNGFHDAGRYALDLGCQIVPYLTLGARTAYTVSGGGRSPVDQAPLGLWMFDASALARAGYPVPLGRRRVWEMFLGGEFEGGLLVATTTLRGASRTAPLPRLAAHAVIGFYTRYFGFSLRAGYHRAVWPDALGAAGTDLVLDGFSGGVALEGRI